MKSSKFDNPYIVFLLAESSIIGKNYKYEKKCLLIICFDQKEKGNCHLQVYHWRYI